MTERLYFSGFKRRGLQLEVINLEVDHRKVVEKAAERRRTDDYDTVWCVLDTELDPRMTQDLAKAAQDGDVRLVLSAPSFDFWLILHKNPEHRRPFGSAEAAKRELKRLVPGWEPGCTHFADFSDGLDGARKHAALIDPGPKHENHLFTEAWRLVDFLDPGNEITDDGCC
ncbi:RloB family protein [Actinocorallia sp. API 0066]|nr:RloB family protein [Actinocorallia sp. API 0066]